MPELKTLKPLMKKAERNLSEERRRELKKAYIEQTFQQKRIKKEDLITSQIKTLMKLSSGIQKILFQEYLMCDRIEYLPNGIPYVVVDSPLVADLQGTFISAYIAGKYNRLNRPLILVFSSSNEIHRKSIAMHEYIEWSRHNPSKDLASNKAHLFAVRQENPRLRLSGLSDRQYMNAGFYALSTELQSVFDRIKNLKIMASKAFKVHGIRFIFYFDGQNYRVSLINRQNQLIEMGYISKDGKLKQKLP
jgi:hypothetical protein